MKKLMILATLLITLVLSGCSQNKPMQIEVQELPHEQMELLTLTGNRVFKYKLKNIVDDENYEMKWVYEVYQDGKKIKDEMIMGMGYEATDEKIEDMNVSLNIQDNKIRCMSGGALGYLDIKEDITKLSYHSLANNLNINIGDEIYLFHGASSTNGFKLSDLGLLSKEDKDDYINKHKTNVFIKLVLEKM